MKRDPLISHLLTFLQKRLRKKDHSLLLGLSGGPDSLALFFALIECQTALHFQLAVAHVDHRWRPESASEAFKLENLIKSYRIPFHLKVLNLKDARNLEEAAREKRLAFFKEIALKNRYDTLILGHQLNDRAETVLKNILEGANLTSCNGINAQNSINGLEIWRPFLNLQKNVLLQWLKQKKVTPFFDQTNENPIFLRARMRKDIIPFLDQTFGKRVLQSLISHGDECQELKAFLLNHLKDIFSKIQSSSWGCFVDLTPFFDKLSTFECKFIIRYLCHLQKCYPSRDCISKCAHHLVTKAANKKFLFGKMTLHVDRLRLFLVRSKLTEMNRTQVSLESGEQFGNWSLQVEDIHTFEPPTNWQDLLAGRASVVLPKKEMSYSLGVALLNSLYPRSNPVSKWWCSHKTPKFLRNLFPVIWYKGELVHEFLTGKMKARQPNDCLQKITLIRIE